MGPSTSSPSRTTTATKDCWDSKFGRWNAVNIGPKVKTGGQELTGKAAKTASWDEYKTVPVGTVEVKQAGEQVLKIRPRDPKTWKAINLRSVRLQKVP